MADMRHAVRVCYPLWKAWVDVTQRRIQDSATVCISFPSTAVLVAIFDQACGRDRNDRDHVRGPCL